MSTTKATESPASSSAETAQKGDRGTFADLLSGKTPGVKNIEAAYSRAGASAHHTPGHASKLGSQEQLGTNEAQGVGSEKFSKGFSDQRQEVCCSVWLFLSKH